jgi:hypothetical protein
MAPSTMLDGFFPRNEPLHLATRAASKMASATWLLTRATAPRLPFLVLPNEEWWTTAGSFVLILGFLLG